MTYTVIINIAGRGTPLANGDTSQVGHMWYSLNDGSGNDPISYGFAPVDGATGLDKMYGPGSVHDNDNTNYQTRDYVKIIEITKEQYDAMKGFGDNPTANGFTTYNKIKGVRLELSCQHEPCHADPSERSRHCDRHSL